MPPKKRKADATDGGSGSSPTPKKSKKQEARDEARARAKAWHDARNAGKSSTPAAASPKKTTTTTTTTASPSFSAGRTPRKSSTPSKTASTGSGTPKRRRTPSRKSTGGIATSRTASIKKETPVKRGRRSMAASTSTSFEFAPPVEESAVEEESEEEEAAAMEESSDIETTKEEAAVQSPPVKYEFGTNAAHDPEEEINDDPSAAKKKRDDGRAAIRALRDGREQQGLRVSHDHRVTHHTAAQRLAEERKSPPKMNSPDPPTTADMAVALAVAAAKKSKTATSTRARGRSLDPSSSRTRGKSPDPPGTTMPKPVAARAKSTSRSTKSNIPPPSVSSIFSNNKPNHSSAHRPYKQKFDPNKPFPSTGYKLPTAAYCGCGPTPGSQTSSVRGVAASIDGSGTNGGGSFGDLCATNNEKRSGSFTTKGNLVRGGMENIAVDVQNVTSEDERRRSIEGKDDERKIAAARPSPPGRNADWKEVAEHQQPRVDVPVPAAPPAAAAAPVTPVSAGALNAAISRVTSLLSHSAADHQKTREMMGIRSSNIRQSVPSGVQQGEQQPENQRMPPRNVMLTEQQMDAMNATLDNGGEEGRPSVDPPMIDSSSIPYAATLQRFREAGTGAGSATINASSEVNMKRDPDEGTTVTTIAGEHTSEVGRNEEIKPPAVAEVADAPLDRPPSSFLKRKFLSITKFIMFVQMAMGILYIVNDNYTSFNWRDYVTSSEKLVQSIKGKVADIVTTPEKEDVTKSSCFIDHPTHFFDDPDNMVELIHNHDAECEGNYKQCPPWGTCQGGKLIDCTDGEELLLEGMHRFVLNEKGDACEVSPEVNELIKIVQEVLVGMTTAQTCKSSDMITESDDVLLEEYSFPLFRLEKVAEKVREASADEYDIKDVLIWLSPAFDSNLVRFGSLSGGDDVDAMGLGPGVSSNSLPLPVACMTKLVFWEFLELIATWALALLKFSTKNIWFLVTNYPIYTFGSLAFWKLFLVMRRKHKHKRKVRELFGVVREAAYDRLSECDDNDGYAGLILRDDVAYDMYPTSFHQRQFINEHVWPRVTVEIRADNRVRKHRKVVGGKELEHFDFAIQSKKGRRLRKSLGASTPGSSNSRDGKVRDEVPSPKRRDP